MTSRKALGDSLTLIVLLGVLTAIRALSIDMYLPAFSIIQAQFDVGQSALISMIPAGHGVSLFVQEGAVANTANVAFLPIRDEPETAPFSAVWSPSNRAPAILNVLALATETLIYSVGRFTTMPLGAVPEDCCGIRPIRRL